jgi:hypothetical protein
MFDERFMNTKDDVAFVSFFEKTWKHVEWKDGKRIVTEKPTVFIHIRTPGDKKNEIEAPANEDHKKRFPQQWEAYQRGHDYQQGTPLDQWPFLRSEEIEFLQKRGCACVEHVAHWPDASISQLGPNGYHIRQKAQEWLDNRGDTSVVENLQEQIEDLKKQLSAVQKHQVEEGIIEASTSGIVAPGGPGSSAEPDKPGVGKGRDKPKPPKGPKPK